MAANIRMCPPCSVARIIGYIDAIDKKGACIERPHRPLLMKAATGPPRPPKPFDSAAERREIVHTALERQIFYIRHP
jgi:hypothetical protein